MPTKPKAAASNESLPVVAAADARKARSRRKPAAKAQPKAARPSDSRSDTPSDTPAETAATVTPDVVATPDKPAAKAGKARPKLVRDSFTMPESDFALIEALKARALGAQRAAKKSELLRAGLRVLAAADVGNLIAALDALEAVKTGRPGKAHRS